MTTAPASSTAGPARDVPRPRPVHRIAHALGHCLADHRTEPDSGVGAVVTLMDELGIEPAALSHVRLVELTLQQAHGDRIHDSEHDQAVRAFDALLPAVYGDDEISAAGWIAGETIVIHGEAFTLTGEACPQCRTSPEAYGRGGGVRCADQVGCRWWHCV